MAEVKCNYCGKIHYRKPTRVWEQNYCSRDCYNKRTLSTNNITLKDNYAEMIINKNGISLIVLIDKEDIEKIQNYKWLARYDKTIDNYYITAWTRNTANRKKIILHRLITDCPSDMQVDHISRNTLDNRQNNLRICTQAENAQNKGMYKNNKLGQKYIYLNDKGQYIINKRINGKIFRIGSSKDLQKAIQIRDEFLKKESEE